MIWSLFRCSAPRLLPLAVVSMAAVAGATPIATGSKDIAGRSRPAPNYVQLSDEPQSSGATGDEPTAGASGGGAGAAGDEPGQSSGTDEPGQAATSADEPGASPPSEPTQPVPASTPMPDKGAKPAKDTVVRYGAGFHIRGIFVPTWFLNLFLDASTPLNSVAVGGEFVRRKGNFDLIASMDFGFYSPRDGNYLGKGDDPQTETDYVQFRDLNLLAFNVHFIWHYPIVPWVSFVYGAGVGFGIVLGDIFRISNDPERCNQDNVEDIDQCYPKGMDPARRDEFLAQNTGTGSDSPDDPHLFKEDDVWPVVPVVHLLVGFNFKISDQFAVRLDGGFRNAFYVGATSHYFF